MTYEQIKFTIKMIEKLEEQKKDPCYKDMESLLDKVRFYFSEIDFQKIFLYTYGKVLSPLTNEEMRADCNVVISTLEGMLAKDKHYPIVRDIIKEIEECKECILPNSIRQSVKKIFFTYSGRIKFNHIIEEIIANDINNDKTKADAKVNNFNKTLLHSMVKLLENYAVDCCNEIPDFSITKTEIKENKTPTINNIIQNNNTFTPVINIDIEIENAINKVKEECLPEIQEKEVLAKLQELKEILESKISRRAKWDKVKGFFKWVAEQGIQVASIIVPLLTNALK